MKLKILASAIIIAASLSATSAFAGTAAVKTSSMNDPCAGHACKEGQYPCAVTVKTSKDTSYACTCQDKPCENIVTDTAKIAVDTNKPVEDSMKTTVETTRTADNKISDVAVTTQNTETTQH